jgi:hypothetical protein
MRTRSMTRRTHFAYLHADNVRYILSQLSIGSVVLFGLTSKVHHTMARDEVQGRHRAALHTLHEVRRVYTRAWAAHSRLCKERDKLGSKINEDWRDQVSQGLGIMEEWAPAEEENERLQELYDQCASFKEKEAGLQQICHNAHAAVTQIKNEVKAALCALEGK